MRKSFLLFSKLILMLSFSACTGIKATEKECTTTHGTVTKITEGGVKDAVFHLLNNDTVFYINRALENGFDLVQLKKDVESKNVTIFYIPNSSVLSGTPIQSQNIFRIDVEDKTLYSEF